MKITCPYCGEGFELESYLNDSVLLQAIRMLPEFGAYGRLVFEYCELFKIGPPLKARKFLRLLIEIREIFKSGGFDFQRRRYEISPAGIAQAMRTVCDAQIKGPLAGHNYLKKVMIPIAEAESERRSKEDERRLREREQSMRQDQDRRIGDLSGKVKDLIQKIG